MMWLKHKNEASSVWLFPTIFFSVLQCMSAKLTAEECRSLGFTPNLMCSTCDELPQFKLESLVENCNGCCQADQNETTVEKYVRGKDPVMKLYDSNGEMKEELSIDKWNTDSVEEFLKEKLE